MLKLHFITATEIYPYYNKLLIQTHIFAKKNKLSESTVLRGIGLALIKLAEEQEKMDLEEVRKWKTAHSAQQWIPCSEKLPEKTGYVLCTAEKKKAINIYNMDDKEKERYVCRGYYLEDEKYFCLHGRPAANKVIAWQPLPEPYVKE